MKKRAGCRPISGILLIDKPLGITSNAALQRAKRHVGACKAGHTGSLDPLATGLLPICFGEAAKVSGFLLEADKRYRAEIRLGIETATYDAEGEVVATRPVHADASAIGSVLAEFVGWIDQVPPMYSALKVDGQPLYKRARAGITLERSARRVCVHHLELLAFDGDRIEIDVGCSKGTYIRSLAHDIGARLGCGAHLSGLRRLRAGGFDIDQAIALDAFEALPADSAVTALIPADRALSAWPAVQLASALAQRLLCGNAVAACGPAGWVRIYEEGGRFLGIGEVRGELVVPRRLVSTAPAS